MRIIAMLLHRVVVIALAAAVCVWLMKRMAPASAIGLWAAVMAAMCGLAVVLLRTAPTGQITWKNRFAGYFLPFGYSLGRGKLWPIALTSWVVWVLVAIAVSMLMKQPSEPIAGAPAAESTGAPSSIWRTLLFIAWAIDGGGIVYILGVLVKNFSPGSKSGMNLITLIVILVVLIAASVGLLYAGYPRMAVLVAGGPPGVIALGYGLFVLILVTVGRNARWN